MRNQMTNSQWLAYEKGAIACRDGKCLEENPYPFETEQYWEWQNGWKDEQLDPS